jgi:hypothetical protein
MTSDGGLISIPEWLAARSEPAPQPLAKRLQEITADLRCSPADLCDSLVDLAAKILVHLDDTRDSALELLAADALITYAMEAAAEHGHYDAARSAMQKISTVTET